MNPRKAVSESAALAAAAPVNEGIVNPAKLAPDRRNAICMQCHLEGNSAIEQPGHHLYEFRPGDDLSSFIRYYVLSGDGKDSTRAVSQFEALAQSGCKRATGPSMPAPRATTLIHPPRLLSASATTGRNV
jgi:hypothetical protein